MKLAKVTKKIDEVTAKIAQHLAKEEMAGILERPAEQQRSLNRLENNRFAALSEEEEVYHGGYPTLKELCATTEARDIQISKETYNTAIFFC